MAFGIYKSKLILAMFAVVLSAVFAGSAYSQTGSSSVSGTVTDQQGAVVAGATVKLINDERAYSRTAVTSGNGSYAFSSVPPDTYRIEVEATGFKKTIQSNVVAPVDRVSTVNVVLELGAVTEVVNVAGGGLESIVNTQDASLGNNFVSKQIQELPLQGRNVADLLSLQPGVTQGGEVTGARSDQANITLDGVDVNDQQNGTAFTPVLRVTPDSVDEFRVTTSNADSARGRSSGAQISLSTKGGTNQFRGALYEYHRNTVTTANDFFSNLNGVERPKLIRNLFGGRIGGPIVKDRLFFFYNYEGLREAQETPVTRIVPLPSLGQGTVKFFDNSGAVVSLTAAQINALTTNGAPGGTPLVDVNPAALSVLASAASRYRANDFTIGDGLNTAGYRFNAKIPAANNTHTMRFDYKVTSDEKHAISFRGIFQNDYFDGAQAFPDTAGTRRISKPFGVVGSHTWLISNSLVNNFRYGFTRQNFSDTGDSNGDTITFRGVFSPVNYAYPFTRRTDTQNFVDDFSWTKGNHNLQFGGNIRIVRNFRSDETAIHDNAVVNRSFFAGSGNVLTNPILATLNPGTGSNYTIASSNVLTTRDAMAAVMGRYSQYSFNSNFGIDGRPLAAGVPVIRKFATEEYDVYVQDAWRVRQNLNIAMGLRYGLSRPVYETQGYQAAPSVGLQEYLDRRIAAAAAGNNYGVNPGEGITVNLAGPANGKGNVYPWDTNNFQPNVSVAWSPNFKKGFLKTLFGADSASVIRGGFRMTNDYFGQALAVNFDANNTLGFASSLDISANTYNVTTNPGPLFTGFGQLVRSLPLPPGGSLPTQLSFPLSQPFDDQRRIEGSLDSNLVSPVNYQWNVTYGRELNWGLYFEASYVGRIARNLLASRDIMTPNNIRDPQSGQTWYEAAGILENYRRNRTPISQIPNIPFFENMFPAGSVDTLLFGAGLSNTRAIYGFMATDDTPGCVGAPLFGCYQTGNDWTYLQDVLDSYMPDLGGRRLFYNRQYGALSAYGTIAGSDYHGATLSVRQRFKGLTWDFNYTFSKSMDDASGTQTSGVFGAAFILNALRMKDNRSVSDFDTRHIINVNSVFEVPIGRGKQFFSGMNKYVDAIFGGWQISNIFRYNTGLPVTDGMVDVAGWPTNWNIRSYVARLGNAQNATTSPTNNGANGGVPNLFRDPTAFYQSFRNANPGETGDRNVIRYPGYIVLDMGLAKSFQMPWNENHKIQFRVDTFNLTNTQRFTAADTIFGLDPYRDTPSSTFGNFGAIQGAPRILQFAFRYDF
ncbi:MAG: carboxypeptidase regulatory-like domain-containing protein [Pyrinomonadaceae bacterium]|nr:carboxypeptidase regulatory-like domain-containing protein [Pyrinomonadaceae bacterium]MBP6211738.1 carboxypeptidase regulatory-like domain-containing protein [Pyrinomonadaceae bacterium]